MLKNKAVFYFVFSLLFPSGLIGQNINLVVFNKTGYNLDSVSFNHIELGNITKDSSVVFSNINEITLLGDVPLHLPFGIIRGKKRPLNLTPCGTKSKKKKEGIFMFDILIYETEGEYRLYWRKHE
ncbi:MAG: hypothetical protein K9G36_10690 [Crocinitomicaceae bacterium]|nr:hypothetical protein [Crocinitomicaceae bacterium]